MLLDRSDDRPVPFSLDVSAPVSGTTTVVPHGELDLATAPELAGWLEDLRRECADVVLDLGDVTFVDSAGLRVLLEARVEARRTQTGLRVVNATHPVQRAVVAAGLSRELQVG